MDVWSFLESSSSNTSLLSLKSSIASEKGKTSKNELRNKAKQAIKDLLEEEQKRIKRQSSLLKIREKAMFEKSNMELKCLRKEYHQLKKSDPNYNQEKKKLKAKSKMIKIKWSAYRAEIKKKKADLRAESYKIQLDIKSQKRQIYKVLKEIAIAKNKLGESEYSNKPMQNEITTTNSIPLESYSPRDFDNNAIISNNNQMKNSSIHQTTDQIKANEQTQHKEPENIQPLDSSSMSRAKTNDLETKSGHSPNFKTNSEKPLSPKLEQFEYEYRSSSEQGKEFEDVNHTTNSDQNQPPTDPVESDTQDEKDMNNEIEFSHLELDPTKSNKSETDNQHNHIYSGYLLPDTPQSEYFDNSENINVNDLPESTGLLSGKSNEKPESKSSNPSSPSDSSVNSFESGGVLEDVANNSHNQDSVHEDIDENEHSNAGLNYSGVEENYEQENRCLISDSTDAVENNQKLYDVPKIDNSTLQKENETEKEKDIEASSYSSSSSSVSKSSESSKISKSSKSSKSSETSESFKSSESSKPSKPLESCKSPEPSESSKPETTEKISDTQPVEQDENEIQSDIESDKTDPSESSEPNQDKVNSDENQTVDLVERNQIMDEKEIEKQNDNLDLPSSNDEFSNDSPSPKYEANSKTNKLNDDQEMEYSDNSSSVHSSDDSIRNKTPDGNLERNEISSYPTDHDSDHSAPKSVSEGSIDNDDTDLMKMDNETHETKIDTDQENDKRVPLIEPDNLQEGNIEQENEINKEPVIETEEEPRQREYQKQGELGLDSTPSVSSSAPTSPTSENDDQFEEEHEGLDENVFFPGFDGESTYFSDSRPYISSSESKSFKNEPSPERRPQPKPEYKRLTRDYRNKDWNSVRDSIMADYEEFLKNQGRKMTPREEFEAALPPGHISGYERMRLQYPEYFDDVEQEKKPEKETQEEGEEESVHESSDESSTDYLIERLIEIPSVRKNIDEHNQNEDIIRRVTEDLVSETIEDSVSNAQYILDRKKDSKTKEIIPSSSEPPNSDAFAPNNEDYAIRLIDELFEEASKQGLDHDNIITGKRGQIIDFLPISLLREGKFNSSENDKFSFNEFIFDGINQIIEEVNNLNPKPLKKSYFENRGSLVGRRGKTIGQVPLKEYVKNRMTEWLLAAELWDEEHEVAGELPFSNQQILEDDNLTQEWSDHHEEESRIKDDIADDLFEEIITDTSDLFFKLDQKHGY